MNKIEKDILNNIKVLYKISIRRKYNPMWVVNMMYNSYNTIILNDVILGVLADTIHKPKRTIIGYIKLKLMKGGEKAGMDDTETNRIIFSNEPKYKGIRKEKFLKNNSPI